MLQAEKSNKECEVGPRKGTALPFPSCFFSVILLSPKLSKRVIYLSYFQLAPHRHRCFYGKSPCFLFFQVLSTGSQRKNRVENHACF